MSDKKKNTPIYNAKKFITKLGAHCIHITYHIFRRVMHPIRRKPKQKAMRMKPTAPEKASLPYTIFNIVFPIVCITIPISTVNYSMSREYGVAVEIDGEYIGVITNDDVYGEAQKIIAERMEQNGTSGEYRSTAKLTVRPVTSDDIIIDTRTLAVEMEKQISFTDNRPLTLEKIEEEPEFNFEDFITDKNDPDLIHAIMVKADKRVVGFVSSYDKIEEALESMKSVCYKLDGITPDDVFLDKEITFEPYDINKMAVVDQDRIIELLQGNSSKSEYYEVAPGDYLISIAHKLNMTLEDIMNCKATYEGNEISLGNNIKVGTRIELQHEEPFLKVQYRRKNTYENEIEFSTINIDDDTLYIGQKEIQTEGASGLEKITSMVTYSLEHDEEGRLIGKPVRRKIVAREVTVPPVSKVIRVGTKYPDKTWGKHPGSGEYFWPVDGGYISSPFGGDRKHKGLDIAAPLGTPIYAAADGTVINVGSGWNGGYGNCVIIQNDDGNITYYAHQSKTACEVGEHVEAGKVIGYVGSTGDSTGNHLHFEVRSDGYMLDPQEFVSQD